MARRRPKIGRTGCLFWLFIFLVIIIFIVYRGKGSFKDTFSLLKEKITKVAGSKGDKALVVTDQSDKKISLLEEEPTVPISEDKNEEAEPEKIETDEIELPESPLKTEETKPAPQAPKPRDREITEPVIEVKNLKASIYYVKINRENGTAKLFPVSRTIEYKDSPITRTINTLLKGPTTSEKKEGIISFIPQGTSLISARINNGHLTLNFTGQFEQNFSGRDAILLELSQIMLTSFDFQQVSKLSILIDGKKKQYITGEGIPLKEAYTRQDLSL